jgi:hypothetical protein
MTERWPLWCFCTVHDGFGGSHWGDSNRLYVDVP